MDNQALNPAVAEFIERLIAEKQFPDLTPEVKEEIKKDLTERLDDFIAAKFIAVLSDENVAKFEEMLKAGKPENEVQAFLTANVPNFTEFLTQTLLEFREVYLGLIQAPPASPDKQE